MDYLMQSAWFDGAMVCLVFMVACLAGMILIKE